MYSCSSRPAWARGLKLFDFDANGTTTQLAVERCARDLNFDLVYAVFDLTVLGEHSTFRRLKHKCLADTIVRRRSQLKHFCWAD
jgi:hypothetical protein